MENHPIRTVSTLLGVLLSLSGLIGCAADVGSGGNGPIVIDPLSGKADAAEGDSCTEGIYIDGDGVQEVELPGVALFRSRFTITSGSAEPVDLFFGDSQGEPNRSTTRIAGVAAALEDGATPTVRIVNGNVSAVTGKFCVQTFDQVASDEIYDAALAGLRYVNAEIDDSMHLGKYQLGGERAQRFLVALHMEYGQERDILEARVKSVGSMIFFEASGITPPEDGHLTPFHGMTTEDFHRLESMHTNVWNYHEELNRQLNPDLHNVKVGVRPLSVCEQKFMIEAYAKPDASTGVPRYSWTSFDEYSQNFAQWLRDGDAAGNPNCGAEDFEQWYNFRGLGGLRPTWIESNVMERTVRKMVGKCDNGVRSGWEEECAAWHADRYAYRWDVNQQLFSRFWYYAEEDEDYMAGTSNQVVLIEDEDGDGIGEFLRPGTTCLRRDYDYDTGVCDRDVNLTIQSTGQFSARIYACSAEDMSLPDSQSDCAVNADDVVYETAVNSNFGLIADDWQNQSDFGLMTLFSDPNPQGVAGLDGTTATGGCMAEVPSPAECPLLKRFYTMIDRHESFYQTYSALQQDYYNLSSQPSPLVASSVTIGESDDWTRAGLPDGGEAGFIFLMRVPYRWVLTGSPRNLSTLESAAVQGYFAENQGLYGADYHPTRTLAVQDVYTGERELDMSRIWVDIASLSNDLYSGENEISKYGAVPAEQIESIIVVRKPVDLPPELSNDATHAANPGGTLPDMYFARYSDQDSNLASCAASYGFELQLSGPAWGGDYSVGWASGYDACAELGYSGCADVRDWQCNPLGCGASVEPSRMVRCFDCGGGPCG